MTKKIKNTILSLFVATVAVTGAGIAAVSVEAQTEKPTITTAHIKMLEGASVRKVSNANGGYGIRFTGRIEKSVKEAAEAYYGSENVEYGMLICPNDFLTAGVTLDFDETDGLVQYVQGTTAATDKFFQSRTANEVSLEKNEDGTDGNYYQFRCALTDVQEANLDREFAAAAYIGVRSSASEAFTYTVSGTTSRNIYTVATHALNDATSGLDANATKYLTESVVDIVNTEYTTTNVEIVSNGAAFESGLFETGDTFTVNATVENAEGKKLEAGVALNSDLITKISNNTYEVSELGELDLTATFKGIDAANETYKETYKCDTKNILPTTMKEAYDATLDSKFEATPYVIGGVEAYKYVTSKINTLTFAYDDYSKLKAGDFVTFDVYGVDSPILQFTFHDTTKHTGTNQSYTLYNATDFTITSGTIKDSTDNSDVAVWTTYNVDGTEASRAMCSDDWDSKWVRIQIQLKQDATWNNRFGIVVLENSSHDVTKGLYFANIQFRTYSEGYSDVRFSDFDESKTYDFGTEIALETEALTNRGIWQEVEAECSLVSGNGVVADNVFTVGLGESQLQFAFNGMQKDITVKGANSASVFNSEETASNVIVKDATVSELTYQQSYTDKNNVTVENVLKWNLKDGATAGSTWSQGITFSENGYVAMKKDCYLYIKVLVTGLCTLYLSNSGDNYLYSSNYGDYYQIYDMNEKPYVKGVINSTATTALHNEWFILEYKIKADWGSGTYQTLTWYNDKVATTYIADVEVSLDRKDFSVMGIEADKNGTIDIGEYAYAQDETQTTLKEIGASEIAAVNEKLATTKVYAWDLAENVTSDGAAIDNGDGTTTPTTKYNANTAGITFEASRYMKQGMYLYFDIYVSAPCTLTIFSGTYASGYLYNKANSELAGTTAYEYQLYDADGNALTSGSIWGGSFNGKWITVEFKLIGNWDASDAITRYTYNANYEQTYYLANMKVSSSKLLGTNANA